MKTLGIVMSYLATNAMSLGGGAVAGYLVGPKLVGMVKRLLGKK